MRIHGVQMSFTLKNPHNGDSDTYATLTQVFLARVAYGGTIGVSDGTPRGSILTSHDALNLIVRFRDAKYTSTHGFVGRHGYRVDAVRAPDGRIAALVMELGAREFYTDLTDLKDAYGYL